MAIKLPSGDALKRKAVKDEIFATLTSFFKHITLAELSNAYAEDTGEDPDTAAKAVGYDSFKAMLHSAECQDILTIQYNDNGTEPMYCAIPMHHNLHLWDAALQQ